MIEENLIVAIDLRQQAGLELPFVSLVNGAASTDVVIDTTGVLVGEYTLVLESFDTNSNLPGLTRYADTITIVVTSADTVAYFATELELKAIISG